VETYFGGLVGWVRLAKNTLLVKRGGLDGIDLKVRKGKYALGWLGQVRLG